MTAGEGRRYSSGVHCRRRSPLRALVLPPAILAILVATSGCSVRKLAVSSLADALGDMSAVYARDDDPELVAQALPFALKTIEGLLDETPDNRGLLLSACQGFTQYGYAFVESEAERVELEDGDYAEAERLRARALGLYLRARDYCFRALDLLDPGAAARLASDPDAPLAVDAGDVETVFWAGAAWGAAISLALDRPEMVVDLPAARALIERALALDPDWGDGTIHEAMMALEALPETMGGSPERARHHYQRAVALSSGARAGTYLSWATLVAVEAQDRAEFRAMLERALAVDLEVLPQERLANRIAQRRARLLLDHIDVYFFEDP